LALADGGGSLSTFRGSGAKTRYHYRLSICRLEEMLGRGSIVDDPTDERLAEFLLYRSERGRAAETCKATLAAC
jgi:hypothetical protein